MEEVINGILIREVETKNIMTKSSLPVGGYSVNPYVGCTHACKYCYASFMKRFTGHTEEWGTFLDVKHWPEIKNPKKYAVLLPPSILSNGMVAVSICFFATSFPPDSFDSVCFNFTLYFCPSSP